MSLLISQWAPMQEIAHSIKCQSVTLTSILIVEKILKAIVQVNTRYACYDYLTCHFSKTFGNPIHVFMAAGNTLHSFTCSKID